MLTRTIAGKTGRSRSALTVPLAVLVLAAPALAGSLTAARSAAASATRPGHVRVAPSDTPHGSGKVPRRYVTYGQLTNPSYSPASPVDDGAFGLPADAAPPTGRFEGTLTLQDAANVNCMTTATSIGVANRTIFHVGDTSISGPARSAAPAGTRPGWTRRW
jgi:hypothetical protein